jgi:hypothetical protein
MIFSPTTAPPMVNNTSVADDWIAERPNHMEPTCVSTERGCLASLKDGQYTTSYGIDVSIEQTTIAAGVRKQDSTGKVEDTTLPKGDDLCSNKVDNEAALQNETDDVDEKIEASTMQVEVGMCSNNLSDEAALQSEEETDVAAEQVDAPTMQEDGGMGGINVSSEAALQSERETDDVSEQFDAPTMQDDVGMCGINFSSEVALQLEKETDDVSEQVEAPTMPEDVGLGGIKVSDDTLSQSESETDAAPEKVAASKMSEDSVIHSNDVNSEAVLQPGTEADAPSLLSVDEDATLNELLVLPFGQVTGDESASIVNITLQKVAGLSILFICLSYFLRCMKFPAVSNALVIEFFRGTGQLAILGCLSAFILTYGNSRPFIVLSYLFVALMMASHEVAARTKYTYEGQFYHIFASISFSILWTGLTALFLILKPEPM